MRSILQDLRFAFRTLVARPTFTLVALVTIGLGIGANTAMFSTIDAVLLRPLPYSHPEQLVLVWEHHAAIPFDQIPTSPPDFKDWRDRSKTLRDFVAFRPVSMNLTGMGIPERVAVVSGSGNLFSLAGVAPSTGRVFGPADAKTGAEPVAVVSYGTAERLFGSEHSALGRAITLNGVKHAVVGVMPSGFEFPPSISFQNRTLIIKTDVWTPLDVDSMKDDRGAKSLFTAARLKDATSLSQARAELDAVNAALLKEYPATNDGITVSVVPLHDQVVRNSRTALLTLFGVVGLMLLIVCANVANLLLARASSRHKEIAIRTAMGGTNWRLLRQLITESLTLSLLGGAAGVLVALWGIDILTRFGPSDFPRLNEVRLNGVALGFTFVTATITGLLFGLAPALQARRLDLAAALKETSQSVSAAAGRQRLRNVLVVVETALALVLLIGSSLLVRSLMRLEAVDPGFAVKNLLTANISLAPADYKDPLQQRLFFERMLERVDRLPGVQSATIASAIPLTTTLSASDVTAEGQPAPKREENQGVTTKVVGPVYFQTMDIPMREGREFSASDREGTPLVAVINQTMARRFWPGVDPIGRRVKIGDENDGNPWLTIVGIAADARNWGVDSPVNPELYQAFLQSPVPRMALLVRTRAEETTLIAAIRKEAAAIDPAQPVYAVLSMEEYLTNSFSPSRFRAFLTTLFGALAALLAGVGIYGVMAYFVTERTHEIGIRITLGARKPEVLRMVLGQGMKLVGAGIAAGLILAFGLTRMIASLLFGVDAFDPLTFAGVAAGMALLAAATICVPARRAMRVDPIVALRHE